MEHLTDPSPLRCERGQIERANLTPQSSQQALYRPPQENPENLPIVRQRHKPEANLTVQMIKELNCIILKHLPKPLYKVHSQILIN